MLCLFFNITRQVAICLFTRGRRSSLHLVDNQYTCQVTTWAAFSYRHELHRVPTRVWLGERQEYVRRACTSYLRACSPSTWVCVREIQTLDIMRRPSPCLRPVRPPVTTTPHSSSPYLSSFSIHFYIQGATMKITICRYTRPLTLIDAILMVFAS